MFINVVAVLTAGRDALAPTDNCPVQTSTTLHQFSSYDKLTCQPVVEDNGFIAAQDWLTDMFNICSGQCASSNATNLITFNYILHEYQCKNVQCFIKPDVRYNIFLKTWPSTSNCGTENGHLFFTYYTNSLSPCEKNWCKSISFCNTNRKYNNKCHKKQSSRNNASSATGLQYLASKQVYIL